MDTDEVSLPQALAAVQASFADAPGDAPSWLSAVGPINHFEEYFARTLIAPTEHGIVHMMIVNTEPVFTQSVDMSMPTPGTHWFLAAWCIDPEGAGGKYGHVSTWCVSLVTAMNGLVNNANTACVNTFNEDIQRWNTGRVTTFANMFYGCNFFDRPLGTWDVSSARDMTGMFAKCSVFDSPLTDWDTGRVEYFGDMFKEWLVRVYPRALLYHVVSTEGGRQDMVCEGSCALCAVARARRREAPSGQPSVRLLAGRGAPGASNARVCGAAGESAFTGVGVGDSSGAV